MTREKVNKTMREGKGGQSKEKQKEDGKLYKIDHD